MTPNDYVLVRVQEFLMELQTDPKATGADVVMLCTSRSALKQVHNLATQHGRCGAEGLALIELMEDVLRE